MTVPTPTKRLPAILRRVKYCGLIAVMAAGDLGFVRLFAERYSQIRDVRILLYAVAIGLMAFVVREVITSK